VDDEVDDMGDDDVGEAVGDDNSAGLRRQLVDLLRRRGHLSDDRIAAAFAAVPREAFLAAHADRHGIADVYRDEAIVTRRDPRTGAPLSSSSQPAIMAEMLEMAGVEPGQHVLEIGAGTGYNAAMLTRLVGDTGQVTSVELDREVAAAARDGLLASGADASVVVGDGRLGWPDAAPFDAIMATASTETVPRAWFDQLRPGGRLVVPLRLSRVVFGIQAVLALRKVRHGFDIDGVTPGGFMALRSGDERPAVPARLVAGEATDDPPDERPLLELTGPALAGLDHADRQHLLVTALGFGRGSRVDLGRSNPWSLGSYAALALPEERLVECLRPRSSRDGAQALGVVDAVDGSLALLVASITGTRIEAYGGRGAERALAQAVDRWISARRPGVDRLSITIRYGAERPHGWRSVRRDDQWIAFDWRPTTAPTLARSPAPARRRGR
jgi:protein-L-isoaspartate(D-aspartate) O-methyltransferase